jgi:hypothetical protein
MSYKKNLLIFVLGLSYIFIYSQNEDKFLNKDREKIKAQKVSFISHSLDLSVNEAQAFWPVYNEYDKKLEKIFTDGRNMIRMDKIDNMSDKEAEQIAEKFIENETQMANLQKEYYAKFKTVLSPKKILKFYASEKEFHRKLLKDLRDRPDKPMK